jgi:phosphoserine phosphatase
MNRFGLTRQRQPALVPDFVMALPRAEGDALAVFDADGTLWTDDVADDFTCWMIDEGHVDPERWKEYMRIYAADPPTGCEFLLTFYTGMTPATLAGFVQTWWDHHAHRRWIPQVVESLHRVADRGYAVWIVSGTPTDFLLPLEQMLPVAEVVAMDFALDTEGRITGQPAGIPCAGEGKARKLRSLLAGRAVALGVGNGSLDGPMMTLATQAWSVYPNPDFAAHSRAQGWPILPRPPDFQEEEKFLPRG